MGSWGRSQLSHSRLHRWFTTWLVNSFSMAARLPRGWSITRLGHVVTARGGKLNKLILGSGRQLVVRLLRCRHCKIRSVHSEISTAVADWRVWPVDAILTSGLGAGARPVAGAGGRPWSSNFRAPLPLGRVCFR